MGVDIVCELEKEKGYSAVSMPMTMPTSLSRYNCKMGRVSATALILGEYCLPKATSNAIDEDISPINKMRGSNEISSIVKAVFPMAYLLFTFETTAIGKESIVFIIKLG